jgi:hypothetical protein
MREIAAHFHRASDHEHAEQEEEHVGVDRPERIGKADLTGEEHRQRTGKHDLPDLELQAPHLPHCGEKEDGAERDNGEVHGVKSKGDSPRSAAGVEFDIRSASSYIV